MFRALRISSAVRRLATIRPETKHFATTTTNQHVKNGKNKKPSYEDDECEITGTKKPTSIKLYPLHPKTVLTAPLICEELREKIWSMPPDCPPPCPKEPKICSRPLKRLKNRRKLQKVWCPPKPCPPPPECRADDSLKPKPPKPLPCLVDNECVCVEPKPPSDMNFKRIKKLVVFQKVPVCEVVCDEETINPKYIVHPKELPKLKLQDCYPCVEPTLKDCPRLKRLKAKIFQPRPTICPPPPCEEYQTVVKHVIRKKLLPCLEPVCPCVEPPKPTPCCPIRRLPKVKVYPELEECEEPPCLLMDDLCKEQQPKIKPPPRCLPSMILCAKHNTMSIKQYNLLKAIGEVKSRKKAKGEC